MSKICTSIEQSKKLIELGIDVNTADMHYVRKTRDFRGNEVNGEFSVPKYGNVNSKHAIYMVQNFTEYEKLPAWSLSALLDILAKETHNIDEDGYIVLSSYKGNWWDLSPINCISEEIKDSNSPLDAAFEMICWLLENKKI